MGTFVSGGTGMKPCLPKMLVRAYRCLTTLVDPPHCDRHPESRTRHSVLPRCSVGTGVSLPNRPFFSSFGPAVKNRLKAEAE